MKVKRLVGVGAGVAALVMALAGTAGATGVGFIIGQGCARDGISFTANLSNPTDWPFRIDESSVFAQETVPPHGSVSTTVTYPEDRAGEMEWVDVRGVFVGHLGDVFYGTPGVAEDLPWSDGVSVVLITPVCGAPPTSVPPVTVPPTTVPEVTTTTVVETTTTVPVTVPSTAPPSTTAETVSPATEPVVPEQPVLLAAVEPAAEVESLAFTGSATVPLVAIGVGAVAVGAAAVLGSRRRNAIS
jgi:hypothetical protein